MMLSRPRQGRGLAGLVGFGVLLAASGPAAAQDSKAPASGGLKSVSELASHKAAVDPETLPGAKVFEQHCAQCHLGEVPKAPEKTFLKMLSGPTIYEALTHGLMKQQAQSLSDAERVEVAEYLSGGTPLAAQRPQVVAPRCSGAAASFNPAETPLAAGWGYDNARFIDASAARLAPADVGRLDLAWAFEFPGAIRARSQPSIAYGAVYVGSPDGTVYALDLASGCVRFTFKAGGEVRTGVVPYEIPGADGQPLRRLVFGDVLARLYSIDAFTGKLVFSAKMSEHPDATLTGTPAVSGDRIYVPVSALEEAAAADKNYECCTFRGSVVALDARTGAVAWTAYAISRKAEPVRTLASGKRILAPSGAPIWNSPEIDTKRGLLYVGTGDNYSSPGTDTSDSVIAFHLRDGSRAWRFQADSGDVWNVGCMLAHDHPNCPPENGPDRDFGAGIVLVHLSTGHDVLIAAQKSGALYGLDPDHGGKLLWKTQLGRGGIQGGIEFGVAVAGDHVYAGLADMKDEHSGRATAPGQPALVAVDAASGKVLWRTAAQDHCAGRPDCDPGISAAVTAVPGLVFAGQMDGTLDVYDAASGAVLKSFDTTAAVTSTDGTQAHGGSFGGPGAAVRDGYVVVNSGYGLYFHMPGNVLLAYRVH